MSDLSKPMDSSSSPIYCSHCGAENVAGSCVCFACQGPLHVQKEDEQHVQDELLKERYRILLQVGTGGFGAVYKAVDTFQDDAIVAIKQINLRGLTTQQIIEATDGFHREVRLLSHLKHPNLPAIRDSFTDPQHWYIVLDFIEGETLEAYLKQHSPTSQPGLPLDEVLAIGLQLCTSNGTSWSIVNAANIQTTGSQFNAAAAVSSNNVWAVGSYFVGKTIQTLVEHWDGNRWRLVPSPNPPSSPESKLLGVAVVSSTDIWAVGTYIVGLRSQTLTEHWNGSSWSIVSSPNAQANENYLISATAVSSSDVWAVGYYQITGGNAQQVIERWDGTNWSIVPGSDPGGSAQNFLYAVAAVSSTDIWAVGYYVNSSQHFLTLIEHWDGQQWNVVLSPNRHMANSSYLFNIAAVSSTDIWAVGDYQVNNLTQNLIEHWNDKKWSIVPSPNAGTGDNVLYGVAGDASHDIWAVGFYDAGGKIFQTLTETYC